MIPASLRHRAVS
jgi:hypothetical protein